MASPAGLPRRGTPSPSPPGNRTAVRMQGVIFLRQVPGCPPPRSPARAAQGGRYGLVLGPKPAPDPPEAEQAGGHPGRAARRA